MDNVFIEMTKITSVFELNPDYIVEKVKPEGEQVIVHFVSRESDRKFEVSIRCIGEGS